VCNDNLISVLNTQSAIALEYLNVNNNQVSKLNLTQSKRLKELFAASNQMNILELNGLTLLESIYIPDNKITTLALNSNISLKKLWAYNNDLMSLDLKNGKNAIIEIMDIEKNFNLTCIQVDQVEVANHKQGNYANWKISESGFYAPNCENLATSKK
jgi:Leucine-rich repeat (LRR) protein